MARKEIKISDNILLAYSKDVRELAKFANGLIKARGEGGITVQKADSGWLFSTEGADGGASPNVSVAVCRSGEIYWLDMQQFGSYPAASNSPNFPTS